MTVTRLSRHGNGYAVHLPRKLLALLKWRPGDHLEITHCGGALAIYKLAPASHPPLRTYRERDDDAQAPETL